ncbi:putative membrane protein YfcA [Streptomyces sp. V3I8]|uniref:sulfite exporter TauE/SafE family protein n=1 Tax=Streptomyces sp. V3I8 TaxID=3042279 RepID=UPI0027830E3D|nr:sulfite exporter TauE/SafE family protein [Streptomyces sp. V3I8]MDQ1038847.1 putative membrane protein YfcA [Streptomyces sp. V3I8]
MRTLVPLALAGLGAQLVDGRLGMAYGVTSTTLLLSVGTGPAAASATVHLAEIGTTLMSGASHWRFGNVDWKVVVRIGVPGAADSFLGATVLSRFTFRGLPGGHLGKPLRRRFLAPLGLVAGFLDATGGGGWGPVGTPALPASASSSPSARRALTGAGSPRSSSAVSSRRPSRPGWCACCPRASWARRSAGSSSSPTSVRC